MIDEPHLAASEEQLTAVVHLRVPRARIHEAMTPAIHEVLAVLAAAGVAPAGPLISFHAAPPDDHFDLEVGFPVACAIAPSGRVKTSRLPAARVARAIHRGDYEGLAAAWGGLIAWMAAERLAPGPMLWERYLRGPESGGDPALWETELNRVLA
ncbi:MAG: GyrI-like domain-containing protein [Gammaproteobacteria bacterium]|nr:GyrI-like domain-containing protein [Gammaproteobacteria bacterium]